jgi:hypothetical protein
MADQKLLAAALHWPEVRIVIKRALRSPEIEIAPSLAHRVASKHTVEGAAVRYDVYKTAKARSL